MKKMIIIALLALIQAANAQDSGHRNKPQGISPKEMEAYTLKAESKAAEFFSYIELLTDSSANAEMKTQTAAEAAKLYKYDSETIENIFDEKESIVTVQKLLELASAQKKKVHIYINSVQVMLIDENARRSEWMMTYDVIAGKRIKNVSQIFIMVLEEKKFGNTKKLVWNSYLGEMRVTK